MTRLSGEIDQSVSADSTGNIEVRMNGGKF